MATNYPTSLDTFVNPTGTDPLTSPSHAAQHSDINDAVEALQAKVGVDNSMVGTSLEAKVNSLQNDLITTAKIADGAVTTVKIADSAVTTAKINNLAVTDTKLASNAVTTAKIADGNVTAAKLGSNAVTTVKILDSNVTTAKIDNLAVTEVKIGGNAVTNAKIANLAVTEAKLATNAVTAVKIASNAVTDVKIASSAVTNAKIANLAVTEAKLATAVLSSAWSATSFATGALPGQGPRLQHKKVGNIVYLYGGIRAAGGANAVLLPAGFRPPVTFRAPCVNVNTSNDAISLNYLTVTTAGNVVLSVGVGSPSDCYINISFQV